MSISHLFALLKPAATVRIHCRGKRGAVLSLKTTFSSRLFLCWATRIRSACCASEGLSSWCIGGASLCDYDANSRYRQVNKFPRQYRLFTSDLWSCTTSSLLGLLSVSAAVRIPQEEQRSA